MALVSESAVLIGSHAANSRASFPIPRRPPIVQPRPPCRSCSGALFLHHAGRRPFNLAHDAERLRSWPSIGCIIMPSSDLSTSRTRPSGSNLGRHVSYTTPGINPSIPKRIATHRQADPPGACHRACSRQPRQSLRAGVKTRRPAQVSTLPTKIACREPALPMLSGNPVSWLLRHDFDVGPALPMLSGNPVLPGSVAVSRPRTARRWANLLRLPNDLPGSLAVSRPRTEPFFCLRLYSPAAYQDQLP